MAGAALKLEIRLIGANPVVAGTSLGASLLAVVAVVLFMKVCSPPPPLLFRDGTGPVLIGTTCPFSLSTTKISTPPSGVLIAFAVATFDLRTCTPYSLRMMLFLVAELAFIFFIISSRSIAVKFSGIFLIASSNLVSSRASFAFISAICAGVSSIGAAGAGCLGGVEFCDLGAGEPSVRMKLGYCGRKLSSC
jgi:hypothetical protein